MAIFYGLRNENENARKWPFLSRHFLNPILWGTKMAISKQPLRALVCSEMEPIFERFLGRSEMRVIVIWKALEPRHH